MPRISIELPEDKLLKLIPILLKEGIKHMVSPDKQQELINVTPKQGELFNDTNQSIIASGQSVPRNVKTVHHVKGRTLNDIVLEYFTDPQITITSEFVGNEITKLGFKSGSASSALNALWVANKLTRIREGKSFYYSLNKSDDSII